MTGENGEHGRGEGITPPPHRMPSALFDAVAMGGGGAEALRLLARAEHSRRLACAYAVTAAARETGGAVAEEAARAWELLAAATRADPAAGATVLKHPAAGPALFGLLAALRRGPDPGRAALGRFTALAAAAAVRAGLPVRLAWQVEGPWMALPSLGRACFPRADAPYGGTAEVVVGTDGTARVTLSGPREKPGRPGPRQEPRVREERGPRRDTDPPDPPFAPEPAREPGWWTAPEHREAPVVLTPSGGRWHTPRHLSTLAPGAPLLLDVLDQPGFPNAVRPPGPRTPEVGRWRAVARPGCAMLRAEHPETYGELAADTRLLVPLVRSGQGSVSGSTAEMFGCVGMSRPATATGFAVTMAHEMQHNKFAAVLHLFDLLEPSEGPDRFYAPWRPDPRPLIGLFHGAYAHLGVALFWARRRETGPTLQTEAHVQFARWRLAARDATLVILASGRLTPLGRRFADRMLDALDALCRQPVPLSARIRAESAARAHLTAWQARNGVPERALPA
ncbi:aKG-HExxH-type peptide beta-hydroxylase [Streptomyces sp. T028]|uniref:aKG-HExxH-type peptide beta-hydroxylase n=1 Tax=Streptomyces sp. T028 TaxID=3394379 RepID=UPI003A8B4095